MERIAQIFNKENSCYSSLFALFVMFFALFVMFFSRAYSKNFTIFSVAFSPWPVNTVTISSSAGADAA